MMRVGTLYKCLDSVLFPSLKRRGRMRRLPLQAAGTGSTAKPLIVGTPLPYLARHVAFPFQFDPVGLRIFRRRSLSGISRIAASLRSRSVPERARRLRVLGAESQSTAA